MSVAAGTDPISSKSRNPRITYYFLSSHAGVTFYTGSEAFSNAGQRSVPDHPQPRSSYPCVSADFEEVEEKRTWRGALYAPSRTDLISLLGGQVTNANRTYD